MDVPIIVNTEEIGRLEIGREGPYTLFTGRCTDGGELLHLSVYGSGREGYLGLMMPGDGALHLRKRFSRQALSAFPETIEYAGPAGQSAKTAEKPAAPPIVPQPTQDESEPEERAAAPTAPPPLDIEGQDAVLLWYTAGDGSLYTNWEGRRFVAIPLSAHGLPESRILERRRIEGVDYAIFDLTEGSII